MSDFSLSGECEKTGGRRQTQVAAHQKKREPRCTRAWLARIVGPLTSLGFEQALVLAKLAKPASSRCVGRLCWELGEAILSQRSEAHIHKV
jgi:hypothetical protein